MSTALAEDNRKTRFSRGDRKPQRNGNDHKNGHQNGSVVGVDSVLEDFLVDETGLRLRDVDIANLRQAMVKSMYVLVASLYGQGAQESKRITKLQRMIGQIEDDLMSDEKFANLEPSEKMRLLEVFASSLKHSETFMTKLHTTMSEGLEMVNSLGSEIPKDDDEEGKPTSSQKELLNEIRNELVKRVKDKT